MSNSKLILIEGIPGSGKTTAAQFVCNWLKQHDRHTMLFQEGDWNHPADFESVACLNDREYDEIRMLFPKQVGVLSQYARREDSDWFLSYNKIQGENGDQIPGGFIDALRRFEIYDLPASKHQQLLLHNWQKFAANAAGDDVVYVFECCFLQNPTSTLMARHNLPIEDIRKHIMAITECILPLQPKLIYLAPDSPRTTLENISKERPLEWVDFVTRYVTAQDYGKAHGLNGFEGVIDFYTIRQMLELEFIENLPLTSITISDNTDWQTRYKYLESFLEL